MSRYYKTILRYAQKGYYTQAQIESLAKAGALTEEEKQEVLRSMKTADTQ